LEEALDQAIYDRLDDGGYAGRIPACLGVVALAPSLRQCERELRSTLEDWVLLGIKLDHWLPVLGGIDLNQEPAREPVNAL
jgi:hypothetical protein